MKGEELKELRRLKQTQDGDALMELVECQREGILLLREEHVRRGF